MPKPLPLKVQEGREDGSGKAADARGFPSFLNRPSFGGRSGLQSFLQLLPEHVVLNHVFCSAEESLDVEEQGGCGKQQVYPRRNRFGVNPASYDEGRHGEKHRPKRRWENPCLEDLGALYIA